MKVWFAVLFGNVSHETGNLHLLIESLVHIFLGGRIEKTQNGTVHRSDAADFAGENACLEAESS